MTDNNIALAAVAARLDPSRPSSIPQIVLAAAEFFHGRSHRERHPFREWSANQVTSTYKELLFEMGWWFRKAKQEGFLLFESDEDQNVVHRFLKWRTRIESDLMAFEFRNEYWTRDLDRE